MFFGWQILAETEYEYFTFPNRVSEYPVTDAEIKQYLKKEVKLNNLTETSDEIINLVFVGVSALNDDFIIEPLDPYIFWPNQPSWFGKDINNYFRAKKGGEK